MRHEHPAINIAQTSLCQGLAWLKLAGLTVLFTIISSCGDVAEVQSNANTTGENTSLYIGPPPETSEVQLFQREFWEPLSSQDRCGQCHSNAKPASNFAFADVDNVNFAFSQALSLNNNGQLLVDRDTPENSRVVQRVAEGHNCWVDSPSVCATIIEGYINNWLGGISESGGRSIQLSAPEIVTPGASRNFPETAQSNDADSFEQTVYPLLTAYCSDCHADTSATPQPPFFANADVNSAYEAARSKIDLDIPENSRFASRLRELHNCWTSNCQSDSDNMVSAISQFAGAISLTQIDPQLVTSKAMTFDTAILASGGSRFEDNQIALWEFKTGSGNTAFDTSGIEPAMNLTFSGAVSWVLGYGIDIRAGAKAQSSTESSSKLSNLISLTNTYSIEAWLIPGNVSQENARIISYSAGDTARNFSMSQTLYNYEFLNRSSNTDAEGRASLITNDGDEDLQATLQHVVMTFDVIQGRRIYVNGVFTDDLDAAESQGGSLIDWNDTYAFVLGNEVSSDMPWSGKLRMVAIHNSALSQEQISQNYAVGVGQKYYMLFSLAEPLNLADAYIMFTVEQYDNSAYLFNKPRFISLNDSYTPSASIPIKGLRIGVNGRETISGQVYGYLDVNINSTDYSADGQLLSSLGTVIAVEKGPESDEFFLTFEHLGNQQNVRIEAEPVIPAASPDPEAASDIGTKTFDEINTTMSAVTRIPVTNSAVAATYATYKQQLPSVENISAFLSSHQMAVAQLAMSYCNVRVNADKLLPPSSSSRFFAGFDFNQPASSAFDESSRNQIINPLLVGLSNLDTADASKDLSTQPSDTDIKDLLGASTTQTLDTGTNSPTYESLITTMKTCPSDCNTTTRTEEIVKATCAATLGSALTLIQ